MKIDPSFGQIVRERRVARDLTQVELARRVGCATVTIRKIEYDTLRPSVQIAERLAMALHIPLEERANFIRLARTALQDTPEPSPLPTPPPTADEIGQEDLSGRAVRGYDLGERIGHGGFGAVYRAVQPVVERQVAIKIILPQYANHPDFIRRFEAEAQIIARIEHPFIVPLYDYWREPNAAYLVMRLLRGGSLETLLKNGPLTLDKAIRHLEQIGLALHSAHRAGIIHRDIKPANILLDEDENCYLADFGIAKNLGNPNLHEQTAVGAVIGSPAYISPEQILAEPVRPQADIYCLGVLFYEMLTGRKAFPGPTAVAYIQQHLNNPLPALEPPLPAALDSVMARATAKDPQDRYPDVLSLLAEVQTAVSSQNGKSIVTVPTLTPHELAELENPYKGLRPFGLGDSANFFGRDATVQELLNRLAESDEIPGKGGQGLTRFLAVVGPSGSGKSSVVRAGLMPALRQGGAPGSENWFMVDMMPGTHPMEELEAALLRVAVNPPNTLLEQLRADERGLIRAAKRILPADNETELLLIIDQFEELFTLVADEADRKHFLGNLVTAVIDPRSRIRIVITLRADFTDRPLRYVDFSELVHKRTEFILPLSPDELEQAIAQPAQQCGLTVESDLITAMIHDVVDQPGSLPLLQYTLTELFERRDSSVLTLAAYRDMGSVTGALSHHADEIYDRLDEAGQVTARQLFFRLITLGEGVEDTRRRVRRSELLSMQTAVSLNEIIDRFGAHRLLTFDRDPITREPTVEIAHEALLREWVQLRDWVADNRDDMRMERLLETAVNEWQTADQDESYLLRGSRLVLFEGWMGETAVVLTANERAFLNASITAREKQIAAEEERHQQELKTARQLAETERLRADEQTQSAGRLRKWAMALAGVLIIAVLFAIAAATFARSSQQNANVAATRQIEAENEADLRATAEANAVQDQEIAEEQRIVAETQSEIAQSRELAAAALNNLTEDPELSVLLALEALSLAHTIEAENALHKTVPALHLLDTFLHEDVVWDVAVSPDGSRLATADGSTGKVRVWDVITGEEFLTLTADDGDVNKQAMSVDYAPNGRLLAAGGRDGILHIWDASSGEELNAIPTGSSINKVRFDPRCQSEDTNCLIVTAQQDSTAQIWDVITSENTASFVGHEPFSSINFPTEHGLWDAALNRDGTLLATAGMDGTAKIWDVATSKELLTLPKQGGDIRQVSFSPDSAALATATLDNMVTIWDVADGGILLQIPHEQPVNSVTYNEDGTELATTSWDGIVRIWNATTGRKVMDLLGHPSMTMDAEFSPDGQHLFSGAVDGTAKMWDLSPDKELLTVSGHNGMIFGSVFSPDGQSLATAGVDGTAQLWDIATGESQMIFAGHHAPVTNAIFSPDGKQLMTSSFDTTIKFWDVASGTEISTLAASDVPIRGNDYSSNGDYIASSDEAGQVTVWNVETGEQLWSRNEHNALTVGLAFSPDSTRLATGSWENWMAIIWDVSSGELLFELPADQDVMNLAFSSDSQLVAVPTRAGTTTIWDISGTEPIELFALNSPAAVMKVAFSRDGNYLGTTHFDGSSTIWDLPASLEAGAGQELLRLALHTNIAIGIDFSPDSNYVVTSAFDGTARLFALDLDELTAMADSRVTRTLTDIECQQYLHLSECSSK